MINSKNVSTIECFDCKKGVQMCKSHPCATSFEEAETLIALGLQDKLMLDWWEKDDFTVDFYFLSCANISREKKIATQERFGQCVFLIEDNRCELHKIGVKPIEGQSACCEKPESSVIELHEDVSRTWNNPEAQKLILQLAQEWGVTIGKPC